MLLPVNLFKQYPPAIVDAFTTLFSVRPVIRAGLFLTPLLIAPVRLRHPGKHCQLPIAYCLLFTLFLHQTIQRHLVCLCIYLVFPVIRGKVRVTL